MDFYEDDYFDEEDSEIVDQIVDIAKGLVKEEVKGKISTLESENKKLNEELAKYSDFIKTECELKTKIIQLENELKYQYENGYNACKKEKLQKLLDLQQGWSVKRIATYAHEKCDKCDDHGFIHFLSPSGNELTEKCECRNMKSTFVVNQVPVVSWVFGYNESNATPSRYYKRLCDEIEGKESTFECDSSKVWVYKDSHTFENILNDSTKSNTTYWQYVFESQEECQKYADWLNENYDKN